MNAAPHAPRPAGEVGGQMGLWAGVSVVTLVEFFEVVYALTCGRCCSKSARRKRRTAVVAAEGAVKDLV